MARARIKKTGTPRAGNAPFRCNKCGEPILKGQDRYEWSFRYGGTHTRHVSCGAPRQSETTQGNTSQLYAAQEDIDDALAQDAGDDFDSWKSGVVDALNQAAETARELGSEYEAAAEPFGGQGPNQERYEQCDEWADALESAAGDAEGEELDEDQDEDERLEEAMQRVRDHAEGARDELQL